MTTYYQTRRAVPNPFGDGRSKGAQWRSPLDKPLIPEDFVFRIEDDNIFDEDGKPGYLICPRRDDPDYKKHLDFVRALVDASNEVPIPVERMLKGTGWEELTLIQAICESGGIEVEWIMDIERKIYLIHGLCTGTIDRDDLARVLKVLPEPT